MSEESILAKVLPMLHQDQDVLDGPGDDCAVLKFGDKLLLVAADQVASSVHYALDTVPEAIAAKLLKRNLSDVAAMGGIPRWALLTLAATAREEIWFERFYEGLEACAKKYGVSIIGGDLGSLPGKERIEYASLSILGEVEPERCCRRQSAKAGELICVTGMLGDTLSSGHHLDFEPRLAEGRFLSGNWTHCMMDLSDGLEQDLRRLLRASKVAAKIDCDKLPCRNNCPMEQALTDGEDYELLFTLEKEKLPELEQVWPFAEPFTVIGAITDGAAGYLEHRNYQGKTNVENLHGYEHFQN